MSSILPAPKKFTFFRFGFSEQSGIAPGYGQQTIDLSAVRGRFHLIAAKKGGVGVVSLHQDAGVSLAILESDEGLIHRLANGRHAWLQLVSGAADLNGHALGAADGAAISSESELNVKASHSSEMLLFDLA